MGTKPWVSWAACSLLLACDSGDSEPADAAPPVDGGPAPMAAAGPPDPLPFAPRETRADGAIRLTFGRGATSFQNACFSRDGSALVITGFANGYNRGPGHLYRLEMNGSEPVELTSGDLDDVNVPWGCANRVDDRIVFASDRDDANDFWTITLDDPDSDPVRVTSHGELPLWIEPVFSPDGQSLAFELSQDAPDELAQRSSVWRLEIGAPASARALTNADGTLDDRLPSWSRDGSTILFQRRIPPSELWEATIIAAGGGEPTSVSAGVERTAPGHDTDLSWAPDGRFVASSTDPDGIALPNIYLLPLAGGPALRVTESDEHEDGAPCVSPNQLWVAFESHRTSDEESPSDIWMIRVPDPARPIDSP